MDEIDDGEEINYYSPQDSECRLIHLFNFNVAEAPSDDDNEDYEIDC